MTKFRPGSMGAADQKTQKYFKIAMTAFVVIMFSLTYFGLFHTYPYYWHLKQSGFVKFLGVVCYVATFAPLYFSEWITDKTKNETRWFQLWVLALILAVGVSAGFNFTLPS